MKCSRRNLSKAKPTCFYRQWHVIFHYKQRWEESCLCRNTECSYYFIFWNESDLEASAWNWKIRKATTFKSTDNYILWLESSESTDIVDGASEREVQKIFSKKNSFVGRLYEPVMFKRSNEIVRHTKFDQKDFCCATQERIWLIVSQREPLVELYNNL